MNQTNIILQELKKNGYAIARQLISSPKIERLKDEISQNLPLSSTHGTRILSNKLKSLKKIVNSSGINKILTAYFESQNFQPIRMLYFNKTERANWGVPWHQDKTILGILTQSQIEQIKNNLVLIACQVNAGDVTFMSPLLLHSSRKATKPSDRRTIHLEYFSGQLPDNLIFHHS